MSKKNKKGKDFDANESLVLAQEEHEEDYNIMRDDMPAPKNRPAPL